jgi:hypothetical protein
VSYNLFKPSFPRNTTNTSRQPQAETQPPYQTARRQKQKMERMNGEIRDREKTMRGLKNTVTAILQGYQLYHNFIREHQGLNGKTPAEACGIKVEGDNKWKTLIQNATQNTKTSK